MGDNGCGDGIGGRPGGPFGLSVWVADCDVSEAGEGKEPSVEGDR